jgi:hypothetical protein
MSDLPDRLISDPGVGATEASIAAESTIPITVRLYGIKDVTLPGYLLMWAAGVLLGLVLIALSCEALRPTTVIGELLAREVSRETWLQAVAAWSPPVLLAGIAFELLEGIVVLFAFRRAANERLSSCR